MQPREHAATGALRRAAPGRAATGRAATRNQDEKSYYAQGVSFSFFRAVVLLLSCVSLLGGCAGLRISRARDRVTILEDIPYVAGSDDPKQRLDLYLPKGRTKFPMVLFVHGGFWRNQDRRYHQTLVGLYGNVGAALAQRGIGVAVQSYRLSPQVGIKEQLSDVLAATKWVLANSEKHGGDASALVLAGYSAGGHLVSLLTLDPRHMQEAGIEASRVRGCVTLSGVLDVAAMTAGQDAAFNRDVSFPLFGRTAAEQAPLSPVTYLRKDAPPLLLFAAERDYPFVLSANRDVAARVKALGGQATLREVPGYTHSDMVLNINSSSDLVSEPMAAFVLQVSGGVAASPSPAP